MKLPRQERRKGRIEIIPMIDAIFFLLVFFMFSSLSMVRLNAMNVALPRPPDGEAAAEESTAQQPRRTSAPSRRLVVSVDAEGDYAVNRTPTSPSALTETLQQRLADDANAVVIVSVDKSLSTQHLISVMDALGEITLPSGRPPTVLIATEPVTPEGEAVAPR